MPLQKRKWAQSNWTNCQKRFRWCCHDADMNVAGFWQIILTKRILRATCTRPSNASVCFCSTSACSLSCLTGALIRPANWSSSSRAGSPLSTAQPSSTTSPRRTSLLCVVKIIEARSEDVNWGEIKCSSGCRNAACGGGRKLEGGLHD